jgi:hypothetical protein
MYKRAAVALLLAASAAFGGEIAITPPPPLAANSFEHLVAAASDGRGFYVLFSNITYRVDRWLISGSTLDGVVSTFGEGEKVGFAASDDGYLVVIVDHGHMRGWRVGTHGELLDTTPFELGPTNAENVAVAWDGTRYVVAWSDQQPSVFSSFVDRQGHVSSGTRIASSLNPVAIAVNNGVSVLLGYNALNGHLIARSSTFGSFDLAAEGALSSAVAAGADGFLVTWLSGGKLFARRLDADGRPAGALLEPVLEPANVWTQCCGAVRVTWDGRGWVIAAKTQLTTVRCVRVGADGTMGKPFEATSQTIVSSSNVAIASNGSRTLVGYWLYGVYTKFLDSEAELPLHTPYRATQVGAMAAFDGVDYVVAWGEQSDLRIARVTTSGQPLDGRGIVVTTGPPGLGPFPIQVAGGAGVSVVLWSEQPIEGLALRALRFDAAGTPLDRNPIEIGSKCLNTGATERAVWDGAAFVVFSSCGNALTGMRLGKGIAPSVVYPAPVTSFELAHGGGRFLVVQRDDNGMRAFAVFDDLSLATPFRTLATEVILHVSVASSGGEFLVVWSDSPVSRSSHNA